MRLVSVHGMGMSDSVHGMGMSDMAHGHACNSVHDCPCPYLELILSLSIPTQSLSLCYRQSVWATYLAASSVF